MPFSVGPVTNTQFGITQPRIFATTGLVDVTDSLVTVSWQVIGFCAGGSDQADLRFYWGTTPGAATTLIDQFAAYRADGVQTRTYDVSGLHGDYVTQWFQSPFSGTCVTVIAAMQTGSIPLFAAPSSYSPCDTCALLQEVLASVKKTY